MNNLVALNKIHMWQNRYHLLQTLNFDSMKRKVNCLNKTKLFFYNFILSISKDKKIIMAKTCIKV